MWLPLYRAASRLGGPVVEVLLRRRVRRGKEDEARLPERWGETAWPRPDAPLIWLHAASVGESLAALPLVEALLEERPSARLLMTTTTVTSAQLMAERLPARARHQFAPVDHPRAWRRFLDHWRPDAALLMESELWPNLILETSARGVPMALINARMSARSFARWQRAGGAAELLGRFDLCLAQNDEAAERFEALGAAGVRRLGNLKLAASPLPADPRALTALREAIDARPVWLAASTHPGEDEQVLAAHRELATRLPDLLTIVVPRHPERGGEIAAMLGAAGVEAARRARAEPLTVDTEVYIADTLGELGVFYRLARCAFVGGSLVAHGGHNPLEAARLGCPPVFGPHTMNFDELCRTLEGRGAACRVADAGALADLVGALLTDPERRDALAARARAAAESGRDVLRRTLDALAPLLDRALAGHARA